MNTMLVTEAEAKELADLAEEVAQGGDCLAQRKHLKLANT
jgi:hypothetical protein